MGRTKRGNIVLKYLEKYPKETKYGLARLILKDNDDWNECANPFRAIVKALAYYTGTNGEKHRNAVVVKDHFREIGTQEKYEIPESHRSNPDDLFYDIPIGNNKCLILSDIHLPEHNIEAIEKAIKYGKERGMNTIILNGDTMDQSSVSAHPKNPKKLTSLREELELTRQFLQWLAWKTNCKIYYKIGNHETRLERFLINKALELYGNPEWELKSLLQFGALGIEQIDSMQIMRLGIMNGLHGHEYRFSGGVNPAKNLLERVGSHCFCGHFHRTDSYEETNVRGEVTWSHTIGTLGTLNPDYMPHSRRGQKANLGFGYIEFSETQYEFQNIRL